MNNQPTKTYLNTAACGLLEPAVIAAASHFNTLLATEGSNRSEHWRREDEPRIRGVIATFLGADTRNIALVPNFSWAVNGIVQSLRGDERVTLYRRDYPSLTEPFKINNRNIQWLDDEDGFTLPIAQLHERIRNKETDLVVISHVQYNSGYTLDIKETGALCREHGVWLIIDATQSLGAIPIDMKELQADVVIASNYKWMNAGFGTGVMYLSDAFLSTYPPAVGGNNSYREYDGVMQYRPSAQSYEPGHPNMSGLLLLEAAINHKLQLGVANIAEHNNKLTALMLDKIKDLPLQLIGPATMAHRCSIILLKDVNGLSDWLREHDIVVTNRGGIVRISVHYYNTEADVMRLVSCLKAMCK